MFLEELIPVSLGFLVGVSIRAVLSYPGTQGPGGRGPDPQQIVLGFLLRTYEGLVTQWFDFAFGGVNLIDLEVGGHHS